MPFGDELRDAAAPIWEAQYAHPFVRGIADGTLDPDRFRHFIRQDYLFLIEYARLLALGCSRAPRLELAKRLASLTQSVLEEEMSLHRSYAAEWGISVQELERERMTQTTRGYSDFLLRTAALGDFAELAAALLPCIWGYSELGQRLAREQRETANRYKAWIDAYASDDFGELASWCRELVDELAAGAPEPARERMRAAFLTSSSYELAFWEMAWRLEPAFS